MQCGLALGRAARRGSAALGFGPRCRVFGPKIRASFLHGTFYLRRICPKYISKTGCRLLSPCHCAKAPPLKTEPPSAVRPLVALTWVLEFSVRLGGAPRMLRLHHYLTNSKAARKQGRSYSVRCEYDSLTAYLERVAAQPGAVHGAHGGLGRGGRVVADRGGTRHGGGGIGAAVQLRGK